MKLKVSNHLGAGIEREKGELEPEVKKEGLRSFMNNQRWQKKNHSLSGRGHVAMDGLPWFKI